MKECERGCERVGVGVWKSVGREGEEKGVCGGKGKKKWWVSVAKQTSHVNKNYLPHINHSPDVAKR